MSLFQNGNARVTKLIIWQLALGLLLIALTQIQGYLPSLEMDPKTLKFTSFVFASVISLIRSGEMFFNKTASMFKNHELSTGDTQIFTKPPEPTKQETETKP